MPTFSIPPSPVPVGGTPSPRRGLGNWQKKMTTDVAIKIMRLPQVGCKGGCWLALVDRLTLL